LSDLDLLREAAIEAGRIALRRRERGLKIWSKAGGSPVTNADLEADAYLTKTLRGARPQYGWLSEETADDPARLQARRIFIVDPIDGTVAFMKRKPWFSVALAVVEDGRVVCGVIHAPVLNETYEATAGGGARLNGEPIEPSESVTLDDCAMLGDAQLFARSDWAEPWPQMRVEKRNSIALRMAFVAAGAFDAALALGPKSDWDVAAGTLIAEEAGAKVSDASGAAFRFNRADPRQRSLVCAAPGVHPLILARTAPIEAAVRA
jgi:myo-inositol-1(or 4)-monophosphatase